MTHSTHNIIPSALADYCETIRQSRIAELLQSRRDAFTSVVLKACKPSVKPANNLHLNGGGLDGLIADAVTLAKSQTRNKTEAAKKLKVSRGWLYGYDSRQQARKAVAG